MKLPAVSQDFFPLRGGLDLVTPALEIPPGKCAYSLNYEPHISGGYRRITGYERYDGRTSPSATPYWYLPITLSAAISTGNTVTGVTSGATGIALANATSTYVVLWSVTGTFVSGETLNVGGSPKAVTTAVATQNGAPTPSAHADYLALSADAQRAIITAVPGSGQIRGVWVYNGSVYAFRDNAGATAGDMYKATTGGWTQITFGREIQFNTGVGQIFVGDTVTGLTSGATGVAKAVLLRTGTWGGTGVGTIVFATVTGAFVNGEALRVGGVTKATSVGADTAITRAAGGRVEFDNANFNNSASGEKMYGADGVNLAFEFDGTTYVPIRTGMTTDTPTHVIAHRGSLFLSFSGSVQFSGFQTPYSWTPIVGAGEFATGYPVAGFLIQGGNDGSGTALAIFTSKRTHILYGSSSSDYRLTTSISDVGYSPYTMQQVSNNAYGWSTRGIQTLISTIQFGDFDYASVSHYIQPLVTLKQGKEISSVVSKSKNLYRVFFDDNTGIVVGLTGDKVSGLLPITYAHPVRCACSTTMSNGTEMVLYGSDNGYVFSEGGTSFDGAAIESCIRLVFNHVRSPRIRKRYRRAALEVVSEQYCQVYINYDFGYGSADTNQMPAFEQTLSGLGGYWDQFNWDQFNWDAQSVIDTGFALNGTSRNMAFTFFSNRAQDTPHILQGVTLLYTPQRYER